MTVIDARQSAPRSREGPSDVARRARAANDASLPLADPAAAAAGDPGIGGTAALLNEALALQRTCANRYRVDHLRAQAVAQHRSAARFLVYSRHEVDSSQWVARRIGELGERPRLAPEPADDGGLVAPGDGPGLAPLVAAAIASNRALIQCFLRILAHVGEADFTTQFLIEDLLFNALMREQDFLTWTDQ